MAKDKQIKLSVTDEMLNELTKRAERMSISVPALCCYLIGEKLDNLKQNEDAVLRKVDSVPLNELFSMFMNGHGLSGSSSVSDTKFTPFDEQLFRKGVSKGIDMAQLIELMDSQKKNDE